MDLLVLGISVIAFGPPLFFLAMAIRHFIPLQRGMKHPWWGPLLGPMIFLNNRYFSPEAARHRTPFICYSAAFMGWTSVLVFVVGSWIAPIPRA